MFELRRSAHAPFILKTSRESRQNGKTGFGKAFRLRMSNVFYAKTANTAGFCIATTRFWTSKERSFAGIRPVQTSKIANEPKTECEMRMWRCGKRSNDLRCLKKLWAPLTL